MNDWNAAVLAWLMGLTALRLMAFALIFSTQ
jgi:hypothetical protein